MEGIRILPLPSRLYWHWAFTLQAVRIHSHLNDVFRITECRRSQVRVSRVFSIPFRAKLYITASSSNNNNKKDRWDSGKPRRQQILFFDIQMKVVISRRQINMCIPYRSATTQNLCDLGFDLSRSLKVKSDDAVGLPIHGFLLMFNGNRGPNSVPLRDIRL